MSGRPKTPNKDDRALFERAMADVRRLQPGAAVPGDPPPERAGPPPPPPRLAAQALPRLETGAAAGVDARTVTRLKRGRIRPEARLDLHGMTLDEAHRAVSGFITRCAGQRLRCVIVITGKGKLGEASGTLRTELPRWLNLGPTRARILAFAEAQSRDGGAGACYVLLRRTERRES